MNGTAFRQPGVGKFSNSPLGSPSREFCHAGNWGTKADDNKQSMPHRERVKIKT
jgi:hypothetical protein